MGDDTDIYYYGPHRGPTDKWWGPDGAVRSAAYEGLPWDRPPPDVTPPRGVEPGAAQLTVAGRGGDTWTALSWGSRSGARSTLWAPGERTPAELRDAARKQIPEAWAGVEVTVEVVKAAGSADDDHVGTELTSDLERDPTDGITREFGGPAPEASDPVLPGDHLEAADLEAAIEGAVDEALDWPEDVRRVEVDGSGEPWDVRLGRKCLYTRVDVKPDAYRRDPPGTVADIVERAAAEDARRREAERTRRELAGLDGDGGPTANETGEESGNGDAADDGERETPKPSGARNGADAPEPTVQCAECEREQTPPEPAIEAGSAFRCERCGSLVDAVG